MSWGMIAGAGISVAAIVGAFFIGRAAGIDKERTEWQGASVEALAKGNESLATALADLRQQVTDQQITDVETDDAITQTETRIIERIVEVPVERVIKVDADCRIAYDIVGLRNDWAEGDRLGEASGDAARTVLPNSIP